MSNITYTTLLKSCSNYFNWKRTINNDNEMTLCYIVKKTAVITQVRRDSQVWHTMQKQIRTGKNTGWCTHRQIIPTRDRSNSTKGRIVLSNIPTVGMPIYAHPTDCVPWLLHGRCWWLRHNATWRIASNYAPSAMLFNGEEIPKIAPYHGWIRTPV